jgi:hypothetical protein
MAVGGTSHGVPLILGTLDIPGYTHVTAAAHGRDVPRSPPSERIGAARVGLISLFSPRSMR